MKFRMAENSLFAILLRSPWWISLALATVIALVARLALPSELVPFGAMGAVPFLVIAVMAARRQWGTPSAARVQQVRDAVSAMAWRDFSAALEAAWRREGYGVAPHEGAGADLVLSRSGTVMLVSGRRWKAASVGVEPLRELAAAMARADARHGVCVTLGAVSAQADQFAQAHGIRFMQDAALAQLLGRKVLG